MSKSSSNFLQVNKDSGSDELESTPLYFVLCILQVWQIVFGASLLYVLFMTYLTFLRIDQIRSILFWIDPNVKYAKREIDVVEVN